MSKVLFSIPLDDHLQLHMLIYSRIGSIVSFIDGSLNFMLSSDVTHYPFQRTALKLRWYPGHLTSRNFT